jgi:hypothetical protein
VTDRGLIFKLTSPWYFYDSKENQSNQYLQTEEGNQSLPHIPKL